MPQSPDVRKRMAQTRARLRDPDLSRLLGTARANPANRRASPKRVLPAIERAAATEGGAAKVGAAGEFAKDFKEFYAPSLQVPPHEGSLPGLPGLTPSGPGSAAVSQKHILAGTRGTPASSGYNMSAPRRLRVMPGMGGPPAPLRLMGSASVDSLRGQVEALRQASEESDAEAKRLHGQYIGGSQHLRNGQKLLKEYQDMSAGRGAYREARINHDSDYVYRDQKLMQADRAKERARKITVDMLKGYSRDPVLPGSSSVPNLRTAPAGAKRRNPAAQREASSQLADSGTHNLMRMQKPQPTRTAWGEEPPSAPPSAGGDGGGGDVGGGSGGLEQAIPVEGAA
jgi:hypothetical protein